MNLRRFLNYSPTAPARGGASTIHLRAAALTAVVVIIWTAITLLVMPRFEQAFADFKMEMPAGTKMLLAVSRWMSGVGWLVLLALPPVVGFLVARLGHGSRRVMLMVLTLAFGAIVLLTILGIMLPIMQLMQGMSSTQGR